MSEEKQEDVVAQVTEETSEISSADESSDEEIVLDEPSDTEDFVPPQEAEESDGSCSSGDEETDVRVESNQFGGLSFSKLVFADIEAKKQQEDSDSSEGEDKENDEPKTDDVAGDDVAKKTGSPFKKYRTKAILDDAMDGDYKSDEDDNFDPIYCGETLSDIEYGDNDERDTESEPETEEIGTHKKTGEALLSIKMIEELKIPSSEQECCSKDEPLAVKLDSSMECS